MSYSSGEALILTALRAHANYDSDNTSRGNWRVLNSGKAEYYAVLRMGPTTNAPNSMASALTTWTTQIMLYRRYLDDGTTATNLQADVQTVIEHLEQYATLSDTNNTVVDAQITAVSEMQEISMFENGPVYLLSIIDMIWQEERQITYI